jgi:prevent-host-death family protein
MGFFNKNKLYLAFFCKKIDFYLNILYNLYDYIYTYKMYLKRGRAMTVVKVSEFRSDISDYANKVAYEGERICVERNNKPLFAVVPIDDMKLLEQLEDQMDLELAKEALKKGKFISFGSLKRELGL